MKDLEIRVKLVRDANSVQAQVNDAKRVEAAHKDAAQGIQQGRDAMGKYVVGSAKAAADAEIVQIKRLLTEEQANQLARNSIVDAANKARVESSVKAIDKEAKAQLSLTDKVKDTGLSIAASVGSWATFSNITSVVRVGVEGIADLWRAQRAEIEKSVKGLSDYREHLKGLAHLDGKPGDTTPQLAKQLQFRSLTGQTQQGGIDLVEGIKNTGQNSMTGGFINQAEFDKLSVNAGKIQTTIPNLSAKALGTLMGSLPAIIGTQNQSSEDVTRRGLGLINTLSAGGSDPGPGIEALQSNFGLVRQGGFKSPEELAAVQSQFSILHPGLDVRTKVAQLVDATAGGTVKGRAGGLPGAEKQGEYYDQLGYKPTDSPVDLARKVIADIENQKAAAAPGEVFDENKYLAMHGFTNMESTAAFLEFAKADRSGAYEKSFGVRSTPESAPTFADAMKPIDEHIRTSPEVGRRMIEVKKDLADAVLALGAPEDHDTMRRQAFEELRSEHNITGSFEDWGNSAKWSGPIDDRVKKNLDAQRKAAGLTPKNGMSAWDIPDMTANYLTGGKFAAAENIIGLGSGGGDLGGGVFSRLLTSSGTRSTIAHEQALEIRGAGGSTNDNKALLDRLDKLIDLEQSRQAKANEASPKFIGPPVRMAGPPRNPTR